MEEGGDHTARPKKTAKGKGHRKKKSAGFEEESFLEGAQATSGGYQNQSKRTNQPSSGRDIKLSKTLSYLLRHGAAKSGFHLQEGGFLYVHELLQHPPLRQFTEADVQRVVANNDKQRFYMEKDPDNGLLRIRANQGHTVQVEGLELVPITDPADQFPIVLHGTYMNCWSSIQTQGLSRMKRNHIHFAPGEPGENGVISGMRKSCDILIYIDLQKALTDGLEFYRSANNVILCAGDGDGHLHPRYFKEVIQTKPTRRRLHVN